MSHNFHISQEAFDYQNAHIDEDKRPAVLAVMCILVSLSTTAVVLRFLVRWRTRVGFGADDFCLLIAWVLGWVGFVCVFLGTNETCSFDVRRHAHSGRDAAWSRKASDYTLVAGLQWAVEGDENDSSSHDLNADRTCCWQGFLVISLTYELAVMFTQLSVLFFYKRVFTLRKKWFKNTLYVLAALAVLCEIGIFFAGLLFCTPINRAWNKTVAGHCANIQVIYVTGDILNLMVDAAIVIAPIPLIWSLQTTTKEKWGLTCVFLLGGFVCVINLIRLPKMINVPENDISFTDIPVTYWTEAEHHLGIVSACLPCLRPLFLGIHHVFSSHHHTSSSNKSTSGRTAAPRSVTNAYKSLDGKETSMNGSKIALVPCDQWTVPPVAPSASYNPHNVVKVKAAPPDEGDDLEQGLSSPQNINVTLEVDVSRSART
ncbi:hypothetical protein MMC07_004565 [Pseudocyphellaria aurata]|nr:hypothetical protein [Pseudocyphellaria aurata]